MKTKSAKAKGRKLQNLVALRLEEISCLKPGHIKPIAMGQKGTDIVLSPTAKELIRWDIECKNQETWKIPVWWKQTLSNTEVDRKPLLIIGKNKHEPLVVLRFEDWLDLEFK